MRSIASVLVLAAFGLLVLGVSPSRAFAGDVEEVKEEVKEKAAEVKEKAEDLVDGTKEKATAVKEKAEDFWAKVPPWAALPGALVIGLIVGFVLGKLGGGDKSKGKKK